VPRRISEASADELRYADSARRATYTGTVQFRNADGATEADRLVLELSESRSVTAFEATGASVFAAFTGGHEAAGERLQYDGTTGLYTLAGKPARVKSPDESGGGCLLTIGSQATLTPGKAAAWPALVKTEKIKCEVSIR